MSNETSFYVLGGVLVVAALGISFLGLRTKGFPPRAVLIVGTALFAALVLGTTTYAVLQAQDEQEHRNATLAAEEEEAAAAAGTSGGAAETTVLDLTSPEDGSLVFDPDGLEAPAGSITLNYDNPSPVGHNIAVELEGETIGESDTVVGAIATLELTEVAPGEYVFFCAVPGHRESGMEGDLTVTGPES